MSGHDHDSRALTDWLADSTYSTCTDIKITLTAVWSDGELWGVSVEILIHLDHSYPKGAFKSGTTGKRLRIIEGVSSLIQEASSVLLEIPEDVSWR